jgi:16S rRNA (uracil1498-N3)-methyltransferase
VITLLVAPAALAAPEVEVGGDAFRHHFRARRAAVGERVRLVDGRGGARFAEVVRVERRAAWVRVDEAAPANDPARHVELLVAAPRPERAAWLVEKAGELGVAAVRFLSSERAPRAIGPSSLARLRRVAAAALEQAQGARLTEVSGVHGWDELPRLLEALPGRLLLDPAARSAPQVSAPAVAVLVGPEGGFTAAEAAALAALGCVGASLGPRALRVETAAVAAAVALLAPE